MNPVMELSLFFFQFTILGTPGGIFLASTDCVEKILVVRLNDMTGLDGDGGEVFAGCGFFGGVFVIGVLRLNNPPPPPDLVLASR